MKTDTYSQNGNRLHTHKLKKNHIFIILFKSLKCSCNRAELFEHFSKTYFLLINHKKVMNFCMAAYGGWIVYVAKRPLVNALILAVWNERVEKYELK